MELKTIGRSVCGLKGVGGNRTQTTMSVKLEFIIEIRMYVVTLQLRLLPTSLSLVRDVWSKVNTNASPGFLATVQSEVRKQSTLSCVMPFTSNKLSSKKASYFSDKPLCHPPKLLS